MNRKEEKRLIVIKTSGVLPELGFITGPVLMPWYVPVSKLVQLINNGRDVWEVNPENREERVKLTIKNVRISNFGKPANVTTTKVESKDINKESIKKAVEKSEIHITNESTTEVKTKPEPVVKKEEVKSATSITGDFKKKK